MCSSPLVPAPMLRGFPAVTASQKKGAGKLWTLVCIVSGHVPKNLETVSSRLVYKVAEYKLRGISQGETTDHASCESHTTAQVLQSGVPGSESPEALFSCRGNCSLLLLLLCLQSWVMILILHTLQFSCCFLELLLDLFSDVSLQP